MCLWNPGTKVMSRWGVRHDADASVVNEELVQNDVMNEFLVQNSVMNEEMFQNSVMNEKNREQLREECQN